MSLAILEAGAPPPDLLAEFGHYPAMFERLLGLEATTYEVRAGELPASDRAALPGRKRQRVSGDADRDGGSERRPEPKSASESQAATLRSRGYGS